MNGQEQLAARAARIAAAGESIDTSSLLKVAEKAAVAVHRAAAHQGDQIVVKVNPRHGGVKIVVAGPHASRYKAMVNRAIHEQMDQVRSSVRASLIERVKP